MASYSKRQEEGCRGTGAQKMVDECTEEAELGTRTFGNYYFASIFLPSSSLLPFLSPSLLKAESLYITQAGQPITLNTAPAS